MQRCQISDDAVSQPDDWFHAARSKWYHTAEMQVGLETDPSEMLNEIIRTTRPAGIVSDVGCACNCTPVSIFPNY